MASAREYLESIIASCAYLQNVPDLEVGFHTLREVDNDLDSLVDAIKEGVI